ncbi:AAA family ATPase [Duganella callida]|uniref:AAA family ATPase n=1 Tax=Duganella callida TaxID=2561932 RepID=UPI0014306B60|nr:AAA family ATPase [Duganella callida]
MKIAKFSATKVHGHYNFDFRFFPDINFLVGINGSGKTTALRLIQAILTLDFSTLQTIKFSRLVLVVERDNRNHEIQIHNEGKGLVVIFDGTPADQHVPFLGDEERILYMKNDRLDDHYEQLRLQFLKSLGDSNRRLISGEHPLFLGLERRTNRYDEELNFPDDHRRVTLRHGSYVRRETFEGLENCARLIEQSYKNYRRLSDLSFDKLIRVLIESSFDYVQFDSKTLSTPAETYTDLQSLLARREELEQFAYNFGDSRLFKPTVDSFFKKIAELLESEDKNELSLELLLNRAQILRFQKIFGELDSQKKASERAYLPIKSFEAALNRFFESSRKSAEIDSIGKLKIMHNGENVPVQSLSSGEKQLIILLAHASLSKNKGGVVIVDEPELSLHLRWQEMLVDELVGGNKNNQYIFATHSPEIVGYRKENCVRVG